MSIAELAERYGSNKAEPAQRYDTFYEGIFGPRRNEVTSFLEIGLALANVYVTDGAINRDVPTSLRIWVDYFPRASVVGFDIKDFSFVRLPRARIYRGDQGDERDLLRLASCDEAPFDGIIDDGSHISKHQQLTLECLFRALAPGGHYCIEDLHIQFARDTIESGIRTVDLIRRWEGGDWHNPGMDPGRFEYLREHIDAIQWGGYRQRAVALKKR